jgi:hypothetical protein
VINAELAQATLADRTRKEIEAANITFAESNPKHSGVGKATFPKPCPRTE